MTQRAPHIRLHRRPPGPSLFETIGRLASHPYQELLLQWNWKSALLSSLVRGGIFFGVNLTASTEAAIAAFITEFVYRSFTSGFYGGLTQAFSRVQPAWQGLVGALLVLPMANHTLEFLAHWASGTEKLAASIMASLVFTALSTTFHVFVMRRGLLVVGEGSQGLLADLKQMPRAVALFAACPFVFLWRRLPESSAARRADELIRS